MRKGIAHHVALGGVLAALAMVVMCFIGLIPVATFVCPMICIMIGAIVYRNCGNSIGWAWYGTVALMAVFFAPDKEAALIFLLMGYYPILKARFDRCKKGVAFLYKALYFNSVIALLYALLLKILGLTDLYNEYQQIGLWFGIVLIILGNISFFLLDFILKRIIFR